MVSRDCGILPPIMRVPFRRVLAVGRYGKVKLVRFQLGPGNWGLATWT